MKIDRFIDCKNELGEGPVWCPIEEKLWWIDISNPHLFCADRNGQVISDWLLPKPPGSFAIREDGTLYITFRSGPALFKPKSGEITFLSVPSLDLGDTRFNDGKTDRKGRFWVGTMDKKVERSIGALYRFDGLTLLKKVDQGFTISNGIGWSPDNKTMYFADTPSRSIISYDYDLDTGNICNKKLFVQCDAGQGGPDGLTVDSEGGVWSVQFDRWCINRYDKSGKLSQVVELPVQRPTSAVFGGENFQTLFVTTATMHLTVLELNNQPLAGAVLSFDPGYGGLPEHRLSF